MTAKRPEPIDPASERGKQMAARLSQTFADVRRNAAIRRAAAEARNKSTA